MRDEARGKERAARTASFRRLKSWQVHLGGRSLLSEGTICSQELSKFIVRPSALRLQMFGDGSRSETEGKRGGTAIYPMNK